MKVVIVGGVAGGASAAARLRRLDEGAQIIIFERSGHISYANCGLPYYIGGVIEDEGELTLQTPGSFFARFRIDARVRHEVTNVDAARKCVRVKNLETGAEFEETYDKLILSPGAKPVRPNLPGADLSGIFTLRTVEDTLRIRDFVREKKPGRAVVVGGGFIGLEMAENLRAAGAQVTIVEKADQVLAPLDKDMAAQVHSLLRRNGVKLCLQRGVAGFERRGDAIITRLDSAEEIPGDMVLLAMGVKPDADLARAAGLKIGRTGGIFVNDRMETSEKDIYAVGDAVEARNFVTGEETLISLAGPANKQGRIAADNICGIDSRYAGSQGSSVIKLFDMTVASTGINEKTAKAAGIACDKIVLSPASHASYYPGGRVMTMKVIFEKETFRLLGAQIVGWDGVDKRIDVLATAIRCGMKGPELAQLDLAYAPPYSSAKDPVNMAGFIMENIAKGKMGQFHWHDVAALGQNPDAFLLDTRTPGEFARGHADGFVNIPVDELRDRLDEVPKDKKVYVMCQSGLRSYIATRILAQNGFECYNFSGGYRFYEMVLSDRAAAEKAWPCGMDKN